MLSNSILLHDKSYNSSQVHHGGAGTTAAGLKAAVSNFSFSRDHL